MTTEWLFLLLSLVTTAAGQISYKIYFRAYRRRYVLLAVAMFVTATGCAYLALRDLSIGLVYMTTAATQLVVAGLAWLVLKERLTRDHGIALVLIVGGVVIYAQ